MTRKRVNTHSGRRILIVDDNREYLASTRRIVERDGHEVLTASSGPEALALLETERVDLVLVDYFMPGMTGEQFVTELRKFNSSLQVILQTGYANEQPPRELLHRLDIQGYHDKSEGPDKLRLWVDVGLKAAYTIQLLDKSRMGLRFILGATPELHRLQPLDDLLHGILLQMAGLLGAVDSFLAVMPPDVSNTGLVALMQEGGELAVRAGTGRFADVTEVDASEASRAALRQAIEAGHPIRRGVAIAAPLCVGERTLGALYLDRATVHEGDAELIEIFANQAAVAIDNVTLYEMAALDPLTGTYTRRFFEQSLLRELRTAHRHGSPVGVLMVDVNHMKTLNDEHGHLTGDRALGAVGRMLRRCTRANDIVGRYGGDEFVVLLPSADRAGTEIVARRVRDAFTRLQVTGAAGPVAVRGSVGAAALEADVDGAAQSREFFDSTAEHLVHQADLAMYVAKAGGLTGDPEVRDVGWMVASPAEDRAASP